MSTKKSKSILITIIGLQFHIDEGAKHRINSFINSYNDNGFKVDVLLFYSLKSLPYLFKKNNYLNNNANWILYPNFTVGKFRLLSYFMELFSQIVLAIYCRIQKYDIIQSELSAKIVRFRKKEIKYIVDFHGDLYSESIFSYNNKETWRSKKALKDILYSLKVSNHVIVVSEKLKNQIEFYSGNSILNYSIISCGVDINRFIDASIPIHKMQLDNKLVFGYCGGLQKWQNIGIILDIIFAVIKERNDVFFLLLTNDNTSEIDDKLNILGTENCKSISLKSSEVPSYLKLLDVGFLIRDDIPLNIVSSPTKIVEYLAAGVPLICTKFSGDYERSITIGHTGFVFNELEKIKDEIDELLIYLEYLKVNREIVRNSCTIAAKQRSWIIEFNSFLLRLNII